LPANQKQLRLRIQVLKKNVFEASLWLNYGVLLPL
jgi:hypothetical protein